MQGIAVAVYGESNASIQCEFIANSDAKGCIVVLLLDSVENISVNLSRIGDSAWHVITPFCGNVTEVIAFDIEYDGTLGTNPIPGVLTQNTSAAMLTCNNSRQSVSSKNDSSNQALKYKLSQSSSNQC